MNVSDMILLVLDALGGCTAARIHKLVFLITMEGGVDANVSFKPHYFGPWSPEVQRALDELVARGLITLEVGSRAESGYTLRVYRITEGGKREARRVAAEVSADEVRRLRHVISRFGRMPLLLAVAYIYYKYPEYAELAPARTRGQRGEEVGIQHRTRTLY